MISHVISWFEVYDITYDIIIMWYHSQTMISHFKLWYHIWCHICISCDVAAYHMWCHIVISQCDITIMWYHSKILWYHMWNHRQQRDTSYVISYSFFHITPWYHMWYHGMLIYDITVWYHIVMSYVMSHPWRWLKLPARPGNLRLCSPQKCSTAGSSQRGMVQKKIRPLACAMCKRELAQINQTRDILKIRHCVIEIVQWKILTELKGLTSVERGGDCAGPDLMKRIVICKG